MFLLAPRAAKVQKKFIPPGGKIGTGAKANTDKCLMWITIPRAGYLMIS
jgi:hypothetical protein